MIVVEHFSSNAPSRDTTAPFRTLNHSIASYLPDHCRSAVRISQNHDAANVGIAKISHTPNHHKWVGFQPSKMVVYDIAIPTLLFPQLADVQLPIFRDPVWRPRCRENGIALSRMRFGTCALILRKSMFHHWGWLKEHVIYEPPATKQHMNNGKLSVIWKVPSKSMLTKTHHISAKG